MQRWCTRVKAIWTCWSMVYMIDFAISDSSIQCQQLNDDGFSIIICDNGVFNAVSLHPDASCPDYNGQIFSSARGSSLLSTLNVDANFPENSGNTHFRTRTLHRCNQIRNSSVDINDKNRIALSGFLDGHPACQARFSLVASLVKQSTGRRIVLDVWAQPTSRIAEGILALEINFQTEANEEFYGFGAQYSKLSWTGDRVEIITREQGVGRGLEPLTAALNLAMNFSGGNRYTTYAPQVATVTSSCRGIRGSSPLPAEVDLSFSRGILGNDPHGSIRYFGANSLSPVRTVLNITTASSLMEILEYDSLYTGRMRRLPHWAGSGICMGTEGGAASVIGNLSRLSEQYNAPLTSVWLQDWVGSMKLPWGDGLRWQWVPCENTYGNWRKFVKDLYDTFGVRTLSYINPMIRDLPDAPYMGESSMYSFAKKQGFFVKVASGEDWSGYANASLLDLTNEDAKGWFKSVIISMLEDGVSGWMCDFGEGLPVSAAVHEGDATYLKNEYPLLWAKLNAEAVEEFFRRCKTGGYADLHWSCRAFEGPDDIVFFMRSASPTSPKYTPLYWLGDQLADFDMHDGLKSVIIALQATSLSGMTLEHTDIGGFNAIDQYGFNIHRTKELFLRWCELGAFTTFFRTHLGTSPTGNWQFYTDDDTSRHFSRMGRLFNALSIYREQLMLEAETTGRPVIRPVFLQFPKEQVAWSDDVIRTEFMLGSDLIVAPVTAKNKSISKVFIPSEGTWIRLSLGSRCPRGNINPGWHIVKTPLGCPPAFFRADTERGKILSLLRIED